MNEHIVPLPTSKRRPSSWAMLLSALLNLLFVAALIYENLQWQSDEEKLLAQQPVEVDMVPAQQPPPSPQQQQQTQQQQQPKQEQPQPEKKPEPQPEKPAEKQPDKQPEKQQDKPRPQALAKPPPPQLLQAPVREKSSSDRKDERNGANGNNTAVALLGDGPIIQLFNKDQGKSGPEAHSGPIGEELSQSEQDYILSQILPFWKVDTHRPEGKGMVLEAIIEINADGSLMSPLNRDDPWNPAGVIAGYRDMVRLGYSYRRESMEGFLLALRLSQPLRLPPGGKWPKWMKLRFAFDDL